MFKTNVQYLEYFFIVKHDMSFILYKGVPKDNIQCVSVPFVMPTPQRTRHAVILHNLTHELIVCKVIVESIFTPETWILITMKTVCLCKRRPICRISLFPKK